MTTVFGLVISKLKFKSKYKGMTYPEFSFIVVPIKLGFPTLSLSFENNWTVASLSQSVLNQISPI